MNIYKCKDKKAIDIKYMGLLRKKSCTPTDLSTIAGKSSDCSRDSTASIVMS